MYRFLVGKPEAKSPLERPRRRWLDNISIYLWGCKGCIVFLVGKLDGKIPLGRPSRRWIDNIRIYLWGCEGCIVFLVGKPESKIPLGYLVVDGLIKLGWICGKRGVYSFLVGKSEAKSPLEKPRRRWVDNIRMDLWCEGGVYGLGVETRGKVTTGEI